ncbi:MAG: hypothetical protein IJM36_01495 [Acholeplasmatales bacterium]|nr:hypothetical protein [Acholeplasmatales bacterium]
MKKLMYHLEYILIFPIAIILFILADRNLVLWSVGATFLLQAIAYMLLASNIHKIKAISGIITFINGAAGTVILLLLAISELPHKFPLYFLIYVISYMVFKIFTIFYYRYNKNDFKCIIYKEYAIIMVMFVINLIACILLYNFKEEESLDYMVDVLYRIVADNYKEYNTFKFILLVIKIIINFITSNVIAYFSASALILILKNKPLTLKGKIKAIIDFIDKYYIGFILGEIFTTIICISYFLQANKGENYQVLAYFFLLLLVLRTLIFVWDKIFKHKYKNNPYKLYRCNFILLIIVSSSFIIFYQGLNSVLITITSMKNDPNGMPLWWLLLIILPFTSYGFVNAAMSYHRAKINDDAALLASANLSFITSLYSFFGASIYFLAKFEKIAVIGWLILISLVVILELYVSIKSLVIGIKGATGKRKKQEDFIKDIEKEEKEESFEEEKLLEEIEITE